MVGISVQSGNRRPDKRRSGKSRSASATIFVSGFEDMFSHTNLISLQKENYEEDEKIKILNSKKKKTVILNPNLKNQVFKIQLLMSKLHRYIERNEIV